MSAAPAWTRKLLGGAAAAGVSSTSVTDPTPASTTFLATCHTRHIGEWRAGSIVRGWERKVPAGKLQLPTSLHEP